ncbi:MAG: hypothetical protein Q9160_009106 [Pyrenula sp. 1 TL-2023]
MIRNQTGDQRRSEADIKILRGMIGDADQGPMTDMIEGESEAARGNEIDATENENEIEIGTGDEMTGTPIVMEAGTTRTEVMIGIGAEVERDIPREESSVTIKSDIIWTDHASRPERDRLHDRSRSPIKNGSSAPTRTRSPPKGPKLDRERPRNAPTTKPDPKPAKKEPDTDQEMKHVANGAKHEEDEDEDDALLRRMIGFTSFKSTQNTKVPGNDVYGVRKEKKTNYRQYMNRVGGFNRPLSPSR